MRLRLPNRSAVGQFFLLGLCAWVGPALYMFVPFSHAGFQIEKIWWAYGILEGSLAWLFRQHFKGKLITQLAKSYLTIVSAGCMISGVFVTARWVGITTFEPKLVDGGCEIVGLETPVLMLQFELINGICALPTLRFLGSLTAGGFFVSRKKSVSIREPRVVNQK